MFAVHLRLSKPMMAHLLHNWLLLYLTNIPTDSLFTTTWDGDSNWRRFDTFGWAMMIDCCRLYEHPWALQTPWTIWAPSVSVTCRLPKRKTNLTLWKETTKKPHNVSCYLALWCEVMQPDNWCRQTKTNLATLCSLRKAWIICPQICIITEGEITKSTNQLFWL